MSIVRLRLFGRFALTIDATPIPITSEKAQALLAYLAVTGETHSRAHLATLLWPEHEAHRGRQNLRKTLSRLPKRLPLTIKRDSVQWHDGAAVDVVAFEAAVRAKEHKRAEELYAGAFCAEVSAESLPFSEWALLRRENLQRQYMGALAQLTAHAFAIHDYATALNYAQKQVTTDSLDEEAHRAIMRAYAKMGQTAHALDHYERVCQLLVDELDVQPASATDALRSAIEAGELNPPINPVRTAQLDNLPTFATRFIGRKEELTRIDELLQTPACRLITLVGIGGIGKTRLAIEAGIQNKKRWRDGVWLVRLAEVTHEAESIDAIAAAIGIIFPPNATTSAEQQTFLLDTLQTWDALLILDNFEQLVAHTAPLVALLTQAPNVRLLVTSRILLNLSAEWVVPLDGLPLDGEENVALAFFRHCAERVHGTRNLDGGEVEICRLVQGVPLALELAGAMTRRFSCRLLAEKIVDNLDFLRLNRPNLPARHQSMRAVFDHSWNLLDGVQRELLLCLAVFRGGFSAEAATSVGTVSFDVLGALIDQSLVQVQPNQRYDLHPVLSQFVSEKAAANADARTRHAQHFLDQLHQLSGDPFPQTKAWIDSEYENVLAAWRFAAQSGDCDRLLKTQQLLFTYFFYSGEIVTGHEIAEVSLRAVTNCGSPLLTAHLQCHFAKFLFALDRYAEGMEAIDLALRISAEINNKWLLARATYRHGELLRRQGKYEQAHEQFLQSLAHAQQANSADVEAEAWLGLSITHRYARRVQQSIEAALNSVANAERHGEPRLRRIAYSALGLAHTKAQTYEAALSCHEQALALSQMVGNAHTIALCLNNLGEAYADLNDNDCAAEIFTAGIEVARSIHTPHTIALLLGSLGYIRSAQFKFDVARQLFAEALSIFSKVGNPLRIGESFLGLGMIALRMGDWVQAKLSLRSAATHFAKIDAVTKLSACEGALIVIAWRRGQVDEARVSAEKALITDNQHLQATAFDTLGQIALADDELEKAITHFKNAIQRCSTASLLIESKAGLATALWKVGDAQTALQLAEQIATHLEQSNLDGTLDPARVYSTCHTILHTCGEVEWAERIKSKGRKWVEGVSAEISNPYERHIFQNHTTSNGA